MTMTGVCGVSTTGATRAPGFVMDKSSLFVSAVVGRFLCTKAIQGKSVYNFVSRACHSPRLECCFARA